MQEYKVVVASTTVELRDSVNTHLANNWHVTGGLAVTSKGGQKTFFQAIVRYVDPDKDI